MKILKKIMFSLIFVSIASVSFAETKMRITLQLPLKAHLGQNLLVFKKELEARSDIMLKFMTLHSFTKIKKYHKP
jgi:C4-dicarboxylate-binding protein DctP